MRIEVNHQVLREAAAAASTYCDTQSREMRTADADIKSLLSGGWTGPDARAFGGKWECVDAPDSTTTKLHNSLKAFGGALAACADLYRDTQARSYNRARWFRW